jgi:hypothetical protein
MILRRITEQVKTQNWTAIGIELVILVLGALRAKALDAERRSDFDSGLLLLGYLTSPRPRWTTVDELRSTGNMTILRDVELRELIGRTQAEFERRAGINLKLESGINAVRDRISNRFEVVEYDTASERAIKLNYDFPALAADTEFLNLVSQVDFLARLQSLIVEGQIKDIEVLRDELATRLSQTEP